MSSVLITLGMVSLAAGGCKADDSEIGLFGDGSGDGGADGGDGGGDDGGDDGGGDGSGDDGGSGDGAGDDGSSGDDGGGDKFDVGAAEDIPGVQCEDPDGEDCGCTAVDILFIVDNSGSMNQHKPAIVAAFDPFVDQIVASLPQKTSVHVGVTRATGFYNPGNSSSISGCDGTVDGSYYPPEMGDNMTNGQQGRLYEHAGERFFEFETDQDSTALKTWFEGSLAGAIAGDQHSNTETVVAGAAYPFHPINATHNADFMRDQSVLVLFLISDAPDLAPDTVPTQDFIDIVSNAKAACGDMCVVTAGTVPFGCDGAGTRVYDFMHGFGSPPAATVTLTPFGGGTPDLSSVLGTALSEVIATTCEAIPPVG